MESPVAGLPRRLGEGDGRCNQGRRDAEEGGGALEAAARQMRRCAEILRRLAVGLVLLGSIGMMLSMLICFADVVRSEEHTSELQSQSNLVCRLLLEKKKKNNIRVLEHT